MKTPNLLDMKAPDGTVFLVIVPNYWGKGSTPRVAFHQCAKAGASDLSQYMLYIVAPDAVVDEMGTGVTHKAGTPTTIFIGGTTYKKEPK